MARARGTDGSLLTSLPWTLVALGFALVPHLPFLPVWITVAFAICALWRLAIEKRRLAIPSFWVRAGLALVCFLGVLITYNTISGVGPGSALLAIMAGLKLLETRKRRDQFVLLFISIFLVMSSLLREQYLWSLPFLVLGMIIVMGAWLQMSAAEDDSASQSFKTGARLIAYAAPLAIAMWIFFPRIASPFWAVPIDTGAGVSGISNTMSPGDLSSLSQSDAVAFRVQFSGEVPAPRDRYWRGLVMSNFNGRTWSSGDPIPDLNWPSGIEVFGEPLRYEVTLEPTRQQWVFALDLPYEWTLEATRTSIQQTVYSVRPLDQRVAYDVVSYPQHRVEAHREPVFRRWYNELPVGSNPRTAELARQLRQSVTSDRDFIQLVLNRFNLQEFYYTLEPPPLGSNPVDRFLFDTRRGFCEHYASAFTVMMRAAGIPARVVVGYQGGELNALGNYLIVRHSDAHAWSEVWLGGVGWQRVDPTAAVAPARIDSGVSGAMLDGIGATWGFTASSALVHQLQLSWDALNAKWNELVLGYGPENQNRFMEWLGMDNPGWRKMVLTLVAIVAGLTMLISLLMVMRNRPPKRDRAAILYDRFVKKTGLDRRLGESPIAFARRAINSEPAARNVVESVTTVYLDARYGDAGEDALRLLEHQVATLR